MTPEDQILTKRIAEADGITNNTWYCGHCRHEVNPRHVTYDERHDERSGGCGNVLHDDIPDYLNSIDAIRAVVLKQDAEFQWKFADEVFDFVPRYKWFHQLTARDWCEAFVKSKAV